MHWMRWDRLASKKLKGGLGFSVFTAFNKALLAKNWWRINNHPNLLMSRLFKVVCFRRTTLLQDDLGHRPSYAWLSIFRDGQALRGGGVWRIGDGRLVNVWQDTWLPGEARTLLLAHE